ncbi:hypothetical protein DSO57_1015601 [Entomophthora muscae]|uniref:Uncharacterized protein n=1 Tax=Entomophthora muscae TaxID=34485 RepID=A0ACC2SHU3_9FUNG|nr:hypothetical protein DSO57_1015601 [Entomophthora muscae]
MRLFTLRAEFRSTQSLFGQLKDSFFENMNLPLGLAFIQTSRDEVDLHIDELSQDLRDGVRLCHLASLLTGDCGILDALLLPVKSHQTMVDNQCLLFDLMNQHGIITARMTGGPTQPCDIANGDRKKTLGLLWEVGRWWQLPKLVVPKFFSAEIIQLKHHFSQRFGRQLDDLATEFYDVNSPLMSKLLTWVASVAAFFDLKVTNFTSSFEDGRVLCCLVSHYFPRLLPASMIIGPPSQEAAPSSGVLQSSWKVYSPPKRQKLNPVREAIRHNFDLFKRVVARLGGMPTFVSFRIDGFINEHLVVLYVAHLAHRIQTLVTQDKSARCIQTYWRSKSKAQRELEASSALVIQRALRLFYFRQRLFSGTAFQHIRCAVVCIQAVWRRRIALNEYRKRYSSVVSVQRLLKTKIQRTQFLKFRYSLSSTQNLCRGVLAQRRLAAARKGCRAATKIQALLKGFSERSKFKRLKTTAQTIQQARRNFVEARNTRLSYVHLKQRVVSLQKIRRRCVANRDFITQRNTAATMLQAVYRRKLAQKELMGLQRSNQAAIRIQSCFRRSHAQRSFTLLKKTAIKVQTRRRASLLARLTQQRFQEMRAAVLFIQARFRLVTFQKHRQWKRFCAATAVQAQSKRFLAVKRYQLLQTTALKLQRRRRALVVGRDSRKTYLNTQHAISCLQKLSRRHLFIEHRKQTAAIALQSAWRVCCARKLSRHLTSQKKASERIQALVRGYFIRSQLAKLKQAIAIVQNRRRACVAACKLLSYFRMARHSAIVVQRTWRHQQLGQNIQHNFLAVRGAATLVSQRRRQLVLMRTQRQTYLRLKAAAINSQRIYRHSRFGRGIRSKFIYQKQLITSIQAHRRSAVVRSSYQLLRNKANVLCRMRRHNVHARSIRAQYAETKQRLINIQQLFRHQQTGAAIRANYLQLRSAATAVQSFWRMHAAKQAHLKLTQAAKLVTMRRRQLIHARECRQRYLALKCATIVLQQRWRQTQYQRAIHQQYNLFRASSIIIQAYWRRHQVISQVARLSKAVGTVSCYRRRAVLTRGTRLAFLSLRTSTICFQRIFRLYRLGRDIRADFIQMRGSAILIQTNWRRDVAHQNFSALRCAAILVARRRREALLTSRIHQEYLTLLNVAVAVQAQRRMVVLRREYLLLRWAEIVVSKRRWQTILARQTHARFSCLRASVVFIQQRYRLIQYGNLIRESYLRARAAAVVIQAQRRMTLMRTDFEWLRWAASLVSRLRNQALLTRETRRQYLCLRDSSITLQRRYRLITSGRSIQEGYISTRKAAILIQAQWRMFAAQSRVILLRHAATIVATKRRDVLLTRRDHQSFENLREATIRIQRGFRNIQYGRSIRSSYLLYRTSAIAIQAQWRMFAARRDFTTLQAASSFVSQRRRQALNARDERQQFLHLKAIATTTQLRYRSVRLGASIRHAYVIYRTAAIKIQATWKMFKARSYFKSLVSSASLLSQRRRQLLVSRCIRQEYLLLSSVVVSIQQTYRLNKIAASTRRNYLQLKLATITIQSYWNRLVVRSGYLQLQWAARLVAERRRRAVHAREKYCYFRMLVASTITVQRAFRHYRACAQVRGHYIKIVKSASIIQGALRARWQYQALRNNAIVSIQSYWRRYQDRARYLKLKQTAFFIGTCYRTRATQAGFAKLRLSTVKIQRLYRRREQIRDTCAHRIQKAWLAWQHRISFRKYVSHRLSLRLKWKECGVKVVSLLVVWRHFNEMEAATSFNKRNILSNTLTLWRAKCDAKLAAIREALLAQQKSEAAAFIQVACRGYLARKRLWAAQTIAIGIQSLYRGYLVRKSSRDEVKEACRGVMRACREAEPHMMLSYRTTEALKLLSGRYNYTKCFEACKHLVVVTQLSSSCRQRLVDQYHAIQKILEFMRTLNRSSPADGVISLAVMILENISRDPNCDWGRHVTPKEVDDLVATMQTHTTPNHILSSLLVTLGYLMTHPVGFGAVLSTPRILTRLRMVQFSMKRHLRKVANMASKPHLSPCRLANCSVGLTGLSSYLPFDQAKMIDTIIEEVMIHSTEPTS